MLNEIQIFKLCFKSVNLTLIYTVQLSYDGQNWHHLGQFNDSIAVVQRPTITPVTMPKVGHLPPTKCPPSPAPSLTVISMSLPHCTTTDVSLKCC